MSCRMTKPTKWPVRPANTQISLGGCPSESSMGAHHFVGFVVQRLKCMRRSTNTDDQQTHWFSKTVYLLTLIHHWKLMTWWSVGPMIMCRMVQSARNWNPFLMWNSPTLSALCLSLPEKKLPLQLGQSTAIPTKYASSEDSHQPAHMQSVFRSSGVPSKKVWVLSFQKRCRRRQIRTHGCAGWPVFPRCRTSVGYTLDVQADMSLPYVQDFCRIYCGCAGWPESSLGAGLQ